MLSKPDFTSTALNVAIPFSHADREIGLLIDIMIPALHTMIDDLSRLTSLDSLPSLQFIQENEVGSLQDRAGCQRDKDSQHCAQAWEVFRGIG